ncbi:hypothetical protein CP8484711_1873B, partial [Chlamydia psittaci 84-8471/1]
YACAVLLEVEYHNLRSFVAKQLYNL